VDLSEEAIRGLQSLAGVALSHDELGTALREVCLVATGSVRNADGATLTSFSAKGPEVAASSDDWATALDELQYEEREGPCIDAGRAGLVFRIPDIERETRWPSYMPRAHALGAASMISLPMTVEAKTIGALNVYSREVEAFGSEEVSVAEIIAGHACLATQVVAALQGHRELAAQLHEAMASRAAIEQAKGIIMGTMGCGPDEAFERLVQQSQHENVKVRELAEELVRRCGR
jgi:transcriptional regulator with GAF, ATPase, and Fis domain